MASAADNLRRELRAAVQVLRARGLRVAAKWASELLVGRSSERGSTAGDAGLASAAPPSAAEAVLDSDSKEAADPLSADTADALVLATSYFDSHEFRRAAHLLSTAAAADASGAAGAGTSAKSMSPVSMASVLGPRAFFLRCYSLYMAGESSKEQERTEVADPLERCASVINPEAKAMARDLAAVHASGGLDAFGLYIFGIVLKELERTDEAISMLCASVRAFPLNWSAWVDLAALCNDRGDLDALSLPEHWAKDAFLAHALLELQYNADALKLYESLSERFPESPHVQAQTAQALYNLRKFVKAEAAFKHIRETDPYRLDGMDTYSNILYVKEEKQSLSYLAHEAYKLDKYRPDTCCIVGNYYSLRSEHEKAVLYFRRALSVNRRYLSAWTLMGHEYVELKKPGAAIEAYRRAVDINPRDYRAWYGLGQTYEILRMFFYALHYYQKATALRPYDSRMWCAIAGCYEEMGREADAIKCYERASGLQDRDGQATVKLARMYKERGDDGSAYKHYAALLEMQEREEAGGGAETCEALVFLATYAKEHGLLDLAESYASRLLTYAQTSEAKALLREIRSIKLAGADGPQPTEALFALGESTAAGRSSRSAGGGTPGAGASPASFMIWPK